MPSAKPSATDVTDLRQENERLKLLVAGPESGESDTEKEPVLGLLDRKPYSRMKPERKREVIELVRRSPVTKKETLLELGCWPRRTTAGSAAFAVKVRRDSKIPGPTTSGHYGCLPFFRTVAAGPP